MPTRTVEPSITRLDRPPCWSKYRPSMRALPAACGLKPRMLCGLYMPVLSRPTVRPKASSAETTGLSSACWAKAADTGTSRASTVAKQNVFSITILSPRLTCATSAPELPLRPIATFAVQSPRQNFFATTSRRRTRLHLMLRSRSRFKPRSRSVIWNHRLVAQDRLPAPVAPLEYIGLALMDIEILAIEHPGGRKLHRHHRHIAVAAHARFAELEGAATEIVRFDNTEKSRAIGDAACGRDDNPLAGQITADGINIVGQNRCRKLVLRCQCARCARALSDGAAGGDGRRRT